MTTDNRLSIKLWDCNIYDISVSANANIVWIDCPSSEICACKYYYLHQHKWLDSYRFVVVVVTIQCGTNTQLHTASAVKRTHSNTYRKNNITRTISNRRLVCYRSVLLKCNAPAGMRLYRQRHTHKSRPHRAKMWPALHLCAVVRARTRWHKRRHYLHASIPWPNVKLSVHGKLNLHIYIYIFVAVVVDVILFHFDLHATDALLFQFSITRPIGPCVVDSDKKNAYKRLISCRLDADFD